MPRYAPGQLIANRFRIVRYIARGGMGEVYEASDLHLNGHILALKTLLPELGNEPPARQRFEREVLLAREIQHPNVCPTYDLFREETAGGGSFLFLTMKLLQGEPLSEIVRRRGRFASDKALPILKQMAAGLDAAHASGVVHRDFKPGNVMVDESKTPVQAVITDFGISRPFRAEGTVSLTSHIAGTPGFVAPEIFSGAQPGPASDIFAFGVVMRDMVLDPTPDGWAEIVARCLDMDPLKRPVSAQAAVMALEPNMALVPYRASEPRRLGFVGRAASRRDFMVVAIPAAAAVTAGVALWLGWPSVESILYPLPSNRQVALMPWPVSDQAETRGLLKNLLAMIESLLAQVEAEAKPRNFMVISSANARLGSRAAERPADAPQKLGANLVLAASLHNPPSRYELTLKLLDAATAKVLRSGTVRATESALGSLLDGACALAGKLLEVQVVHAASSDEDELAHLPAGARRTFAKAEDSVERPNDVGLDEALGLYQKALDESPAFSLGYARLAQVYARRFRLSMNAADLTLARRNADLARKYSPASSEAQFSVALVLIQEGKPAEALDLLNALLRVEPFSSRYAEYKGLALRHLNRSAEEQAVYRETLRVRPNYWPAYNELGLALYRDRKYDEAAKAFAEASAVAPKVALPVANLGSMYLAWGKRDQALGAFQKSIELEPNSVAYDNLGTMEYEKRNFRKAREYYRRARDLDPVSDVAWRNVADCEIKLGDAGGGKAAYAKAAEIVATRLRLNSRLGRTWMVLAFYRAKSGDRAGSDEALRNAEQNGAEDLSSQFFKAQTLAATGRYREALHLTVQLVERGLSPVEVEWAQDLDRVRADAQYKKLIERNAK